MPDLPTIFVNIASYRDTECQHTVRDLFLKAAQPERIRVGICWQFNPKEDADCFIFPPPYPDQVSELRYFAHESKGANWARTRALSLMQGEDYVLHIDAHMRFETGWDDSMIDMLTRCPTEKAVLSTMTFGYTPPDALQDSKGHVTNTYVYELGESPRPVRLRGFTRKQGRVPNETPALCPFFIANFLFAPSYLFKEVPFDPFIHFWGDEISYSVRLWSHGWDIYQPDKAVIYHYWGKQGRRNIDSYQIYNVHTVLNAQRVSQLLKMDVATNEESVKELENYDLGSVRSLEDFWKFVGIDWRRGIIEKKARDGIWTIL